MVWDPSPMLRKVLIPVKWILWSIKARTRAETESPSSSEAPSFSWHLCSGCKNDIFLPNKYWWKKYATNLECFFFILTWVFGIKHILPYLEIVKCFTPARFPNLLISPGKTSQSRHFWLKFIMEDVLLLCLVQITSFCAIMLAWIQQIIQGVPKKWCIAILLWFPLKLLI